MARVKLFLRSFVSYVVHFLFPRKLRTAIIKAMIMGEELTEPRESVKWMFGIYDYLVTAIDMQSVRWGNGIHIKHELMDGIHSFFYTRIPNNSNVLDLGCGRGTVANAIAMHTNSSVFGIDLDKTNIEFAQNKYQNPNLSFIQGNVFKDIPDIPSVDVIVLSSVLEHLDNRVEFLNGLVLRFHPQKFLIRVPTLERTHFVALKQNLGLSPFLDRTHVLEYSPSVFKDEIKKAGLRIISEEIRWGDIWAECKPHY